MPPSQLTQLKASLRDHGVLGPQKSKKQHKANSKDARKRLERNAALDNIREKFNPFEAKAPARRQKFEFASNKEAKSLVGRPGVTRGLGEERRRETLLREIQSRNKVGGLYDRRFGEHDPTLTPEQKAAERFARQNERKSRKTSMFNLEDDSGDEIALTHGGRSLQFGNAAKDDYEASEEGAEAEDFDAQDDRPTKRIRLDKEGTEEESGGLPERKKSKNEVMKEVIAKSKMYKAERQAAKEDDEDLRMELDKGMSEIYDAIRSHKPPDKTLPSPPTDSEPHMDPARAAMLAGKSREDAEKDYEVNIRQMKLDARSQPSVRTKTEEEKATEQAERLQELERKRIRRMKGDAESSDDDEDEGEQPAEADEDAGRDDAEAFGLRLPEIDDPRADFDVEDEDEFVLDDDLIASGSEAEMASDQDIDSEDESDEAEDDGDDDFINGLVLPQQPKVTDKSKQKPSPNLAFTYPCPQSHEEFLDLLKERDVSDLPTIVQRIRALYHKGLAEENQAKLGQFAHVLVEHVVHMAHEGENARYDIIEALIRHIHSMAKGQPREVGSALRAHLSKISNERPLELRAGDCIILTAIGIIFPTSDHFHPVATPAMLTIGRYLGQSSVQGLRELGIGAYCCSLAFQYQDMSKRYVPEVITYLVNAIAILAPKPLPETYELEPMPGQPLNVPLRMPERPQRIANGKKATVSDKFSFKFLLATSRPDQDQAVSLFHAFIHLSSAASSLWSSKTAYPELIAPLIHTLHHLTTCTKDLPSSTIKLAHITLAELQSSHTSAIAQRKPLLLHTHRPLAIKSSLPLFIDNYNPDRHYDPDRERAELSKLRAEHRKERKGAMRELRKDANFIAREQLREKKDKDEAYEKKFKRLVAEIQGEEGKESKEYEREKKRRKGKF